MPKTITLTTNRVEFLLAGCAEVDALPASPKQAQKRIAEMSSLDFKKLYFGIDRLSALAREVCSVEVSVSVEQADPVKSETP